MHRQFREHLIAALLLAILVLALFYRLLFTDRVLASGDILHYFYPYRDYAAAALRAGHVPLWNPYIFLGVPFLANPQAAVLYPLHWPLSWLPVTRQIYWSGALHAWILGLGGYVLLWRWSHSPGAGLVAGIVMAGSGLYGGLLGHINQMNGAAWLPWALVVLEMGEGTWEADTGRHRSPAWNPRPLALPVALFALLVAFMFLAGHTQTLYINLFGLGVWTVWPAWPLIGRGTWRRAGQERPAQRSGLHTLWPRLAIYGLGVLLGALLSAAQLLPTLELSRLGLRGGGLSYQEASSFSLKPLKLAWTLLPSYGLADLGVVFDTLGYTEYVAYVGILGLALAVLGAWKGRGTARTFGLLMAGLGLFLALGRWNPCYYLLYRLIPGFALFRTPARWMLWYTVGMAVLAGRGFEQRLQGSKGEGPILRSTLVVLVALDLLLAARALPHTRPTAPQAVYDVRTAPAHLLTDPVRQELGPAAAGRFLSMSTISFDPGDMADWRRVLVERAPPQLDERTFHDLIVALKSQEILAPNLSLLWRVPAVDGFDGGVLPLQRYLRFLTLLIPPERLVPDGRLREQVKAVPPTHLLNLMHVQYIITDKVRDRWFQDIYYDRQIGARLHPQGPEQVEIHVYEPLEATEIGVLGYMAGSEEALARLQAQSRAVAEVLVRAGEQAPKSLTIWAGGTPGAHFADSRLDSAMARSGGALVAYRDVEEGSQEYLARLALEEPLAPTGLTVRLLDRSLTVVIQAVTLIDGRTGMFVPLLPGDRGRFRLVHSGDVKIYENLDLRPRVSLVHNTVPVHTLDDALARLAAGAELADTAVVEGDVRLSASAPAGGEAELLAYGPERVDVRTADRETALLVLSDSFYPGWQATVDGESAEILPTNGLFRGVVVPPGEHRVVFRYRPDSWQRGVWLSAAGLLLWLALLVRWLVGRFRNTARSGV